MYITIIIIIYVASTYVAAGPTNRHHTTDMGTENL